MQELTSSCVLEVVGGRLPSAKLLRLLVAFERSADDTDNMMHESKPQLEGVAIFGVLSLAA